jgi:formylglycine-generating enzyme required for sulfatase activity
MVPNLSPIVITLIVLFFVTVLPSPAAFANNISITGQGLVSKNTGTDVEDIQFDLTWNNSWCDSGSACNGDSPTQTANWDAAWIFAKFSVYNTGTNAWGNWTHCTLSKTNGDHTAPSGSQIKVGCSPSALCGGGDTGKGVFIYRNAAGTGANTFNGVKLHWLYGTDGVGDSDIVRVKIFGLEMVYIPAGNFYVGDGLTDTAQFRWADGTAGGVLVTSALGNAMNASSANNGYDDATLKQPGAGIRIDGDGGLYDSTGVIINASFPTGYNAFYIMKTDIEQGQYRNFLNTLTRTQQNTRTAVQTANYYANGNNGTGAVNVNYRDGLRLPATIPAGAITFGCDLEGITAHNTTAGDGVFNESNDGEWLAMNDVSYMDQTAFAAWAALRPFTELEFEKAARGPVYPVAGEYAWGSTSITQATGLTNSGQASETASNAGANCVYGGNGNVYGPARVGLAAGAATTRAQAGAGYYGVLDLSGQLWKRPVTIGNSTGRAFAGTHGSGALSASGNATNSDWPGYSSGEVSGATGSGFRGGGWDVGTSVARVSDRYYAASASASRGHVYGARGARTSP